MPRTAVVALGGNAITRNGQSGTYAEQSLNAHAMANAAGGGKGARGTKKASQQGMAGLALQNRLPNARILYVSATGATSVQNLAYAQRLGLWGADDFPFATRAEFVAAIEAGGVAAMEVLARDLRAD